MWSCRRVNFPVVTRRSHCLAPAKEERNFPAAEPTNIHICTTVDLSNAPYKLQLIQVNLVIVNEASSRRTWRFNSHSAVHWSLLTFALVNAGRAGQYCGQSGGTRLATRMSLVVLVLSRPTRDTPEASTAGAGGTVYYKDTRGLRYN